MSYKVNTTIATDINNLKDTDDATSLLTDAVYDDGWFRIYWENGNLRYEWECKDGKRVDGISKGWYPNGEKKSESTFKDGKNNGLYTEWYENGQKKYEETYKDGIVDGLVTSWYENGQKSLTINYGIYDNLEMQLISKMCPTSITKYIYY